MAEKRNEMDKEIDAIFQSDQKNGKGALVLMARLVTDLASTRNSDPMRRFISKARNHPHQGFTAVMGLLIRTYFGEKQVTATKDPNHPTGTGIKLKFQGNPAPRNGWGFVTAAIDAGKVYNDKAFLKTLRDHLAPDEDVPLTPAEAEVKAMARADKVVDFLDDVGNVGLEKMINFIRQSWKDKHQTGQSTAPDPSDVIDIDDLKQKAVNS